jgi:signal transduction histidine kinase
MTDTVRVRIVGMRLPVLLTIVLLIAGAFLGVGTIWGLRTERTRLEDEAERLLQSALESASAILEREATTSIEAAGREGRRFLEDGSEPSARAAEGVLLAVYGPEGNRLWPPSRALRREEEVLPRSGEALEFYEEARRRFSDGRNDTAQPLLELAIAGSDPAVRAAARVLAARRLIEGESREEALVTLSELLDEGAPLATSAHWYALTQLIRDAVRRRDAARLDDLLARFSRELLPLAGEGPTGQALVTEALSFVAEGAPERAAELRSRAESVARVSTRLASFLPSGPPAAERLPPDLMVPLPLGGRTGGVQRVGAGRATRGIVVVLPPQPPSLGDDARSFRVLPADAPEIVAAEGDSSPLATLPLRGYLTGMTLVADAGVEDTALPWRTSAVIGFLLLSFLAMGLGLRAVWRGIRREEQELASRSEFLAGVSHQLKTPVANLRLFAETLASGKVENEEERAEMEQIIGLEAERLGENLERILAVARLDSHDAARRDFDAGPLLAAIDTRWSQVAANRPNSRIRWQARVEGQPFRLRGDERALADALHNVIDNAMRNSPEDGTVSLHAYRENGELVIDVQDEGSGIAEADRDRVFERFYRGSAGQGEGSGLGLAIARDGAERARGRVTIAQTGSEGTTMQFRLPERSAH